MKTLINFSVKSAKGANKLGSYSELLHWFKSAEEEVADFDAM